MAPRYRNIAVIGAGPSGISAVKALHEEKVFEKIRIFERRDKPGGIWHYDPTPDVFPIPQNSPQLRNAIPKKLPQFASPSPEDTTARTGIYDALDSNVGSKAMAFTHRPFPSVNSALSVKQFGHSNPTHPFRTIAGYLEDLFKDYYHLASFNTTVEKVEKQEGKWILTLRQSGHVRNDEPKDYWWQEEFDAVIVASGHYSAPLVPEIPGLENAVSTHPAKFEHSKAYRSQNDYVDQRVVIVGGNVSSADLVVDLHAIVNAPLYLSQRGYNEVLQSAWDLPNVQTKPVISSIQSNSEGVSVKFSDGSEVADLDKIIFATGYKLSYPFLTPDPVTPNNRVAGFYQHVFKIGDPSLALVGQIRAAISFRSYEYQAVAVARYFAGRNAKPLPSPQQQDLWEVERLKYKGPTTLFHEIKPDFKEYFDFLHDFAGPPAKESDANELPAWEDRWAEQAFEVLQLKDKYWKSLKKATDSSSQVKAKL
ncbi:dimethylaniline monooxygenase [Penicillium subrubescens]|uniref:Thiol-specific monooxygenase n=1 Tax=Penicillium subrubescens TaxID=1316194 RepID=A0A1Q5UDI6_9EURO|nr:dimethylaniline monooxygenase [Penicillium subrubescens]KAJ5881320.1 dimethylaniline monooxygenase [Penicillium subrubescens]OKP10556.1 Thiol-specific monooxygenase [Penicillium subrubescens]